MILNAETSTLQAAVQQMSKFRALAMRLPAA
jgi:hypothetical protein